MPKLESKIQQEIVIWYTNNYCLKHHEPREIIFSVPNENQQRLISSGVLPGVSDLIFSHRGELIFCEVKRPGQKQRPKQVEFQERIEALGFKYFLVYNLEQFKKIILHLSNTKQRNEPKNSKGRLF